MPATTGANSLLATNDQGVSTLTAFETPRYDAADPTRPT
jgi:hypothetical protein